jgi:hypothetical protein
MSYYWLVGVVHFTKSWLVRELLNAETGKARTRCRYDRFNGTVDSHYR